MPKIVDEIIEGVEEKRREKRRKEKEVAIPIITKVEAYKAKIKPKKYGG